MVDWEDIFHPEDKQRLAQALGMSLEELDKFMVQSFNGFLKQIADGNCVGILDYEGRTKGIFNIPVEEAAIKSMGSMKAPDYRVEHFLGLVLDEQHPRYKNICRINAHDWKEYGQYHVQFPDSFYDQFPDDDPRKFRKFLNSPEFCVNPTTYPITYEQFLMTFNQIGGNFSKMSGDYEKLFGREIPRARTFLSDLL